MATLTCSRCGRRSGPVAGPFCPHCGRYLAPLHWVALPPPATSPSPATPRRFRPPYVGPPRYPVPQRWGCPPGPWTPSPSPSPSGPADALLRTQVLAGTVVPLLWATAAVAAVAAGAESWRYALLLASRDGALSAGTVAMSDALVLAAGIVAVVLGALAGALLVTWTLRATRAAAERAGRVPSRSPHAVVAGWLVPGLNLSVPGSVLAEIEHAALDRPPADRPQPSRTVAVWWVLWATGVVLAAVVLLWSLRQGVQARADGVVLHAALDLLAAGTAGLAAVLVGRLTRLLGPPREVARETVVRVQSHPRLSP